VSLFIKRDVYCEHHLLTTVNVLMVILA